MAFSTMGLEGESNLRAAKFLRELSAMRGCVRFSSDAA
ncbi:uncharacterized protein METZ01_LOCUS124040 [marine metagenome]|uniref:Uncharacterized protein n=1 Tax=marine metagenome TaxID=408172 RepID=A0A381Y273_9ZZZZ